MTGEHTLKKEGLVGWARDKNAWLRQYGYTVRLYTSTQ